MTEHRPQIAHDYDSILALDPAWFPEMRCEECGTCRREFRFARPELERFTAEVLELHGVPPEEARTTARVLVASDLRGIPSHGVARLPRYLKGLETGLIVPGAPIRVEEPAPAMAVVDGGNGLGQVVGERAMDLAIAKARSHGVGAVTVRNSNHYGIAGYYVLKALKERMIGLSLTNAAPLVIPTHGASAMLGTNPIAFGAPTTGTWPFLLDMATSVVPRGKLEVYDRAGKQMPVGWAVDEKGFDCQNPGRVLANLINRIGGGILPLGGRGDEYSGYKGFGLAMMVDILCGVLAGSACGPQVDDVHRPLAAGEKPASRVSHFFLALDVARFLPIEEFEKRLAEFIKTIQDSPTALGQERILVAGEKEFLCSRVHELSGVPLSENVLLTLQKVAEKCGAKPPAALAAPREDDQPQERKG